MAEIQSIPRNARTSVIVILCVTILAANPVLAQTDSSASQDKWQYSGAIYLWAADISGKTIRGSEVDVGFRDLVENLEMAGMGAFQARKNKWSFLTDIIYLDVGVSSTADLSIPVGPIQVPVTTSTDLELKGWIVHFVGGYELYSEGDSRLDLIGGVRYLDLSTDLSLALESLGPGQSRTISESLTDWNAIVGLKGQASLGERWYLPYYFDVGAGDSKFTWQATAGVGFRAGQAWDVALVYRHLEWDFDSTRVIDDNIYSGPTLGVIFRW